MDSEAAAFVKILKSQFNQIPIDPGDRSKEPIQNEQSQDAATQQSNVGSELPPPPPPTNGFPMNIISWNCRGTSCKGFGNMIRDMKIFHHSNFIILMETHTSGQQALGIVRKLGFDGNFVQDACGFSGGIWCLWSKLFWKVDVVRSSSQLVHMKVQWKNDNPWFLTVV